MPASIDGLPPLVIVDDSEDDRYVFQQLIKKVGLIDPVLSFEDGESVVEFLSSPALIADESAVPLMMFLDLKMPRMTGHDVLKWVRRQSHLRGMQIAVLSGSMLYSDMRLAADLGANHYFEKFPSAEIIKRCLEAASQSRLLERKRRLLDLRNQADRAGSTRASPIWS